MNYHFGLENKIGDFDVCFKLIGWFSVFGVAYWLPCLFTAMRNRRLTFRQPRFLLLLLAAPLLFACKISFHPEYRFSGNPALNNYWNHIIYWPVLAIFIFFTLWLLWRTGPRDQPFYGFSASGLDFRPYGLMLLIMVPLLLLAGTQADFQAVYPKIQSLGPLYQEGTLRNWQILLYELSYGMDFLSIETFFRGYLVLAFVRYLGRDAILPMACFYCTIHFGKPLGECISSYFGGLLLGIIVYNTRSIYGGLGVHLGIAWLMELVGYLM